MSIFAYLTNGISMKNILCTAVDRIYDNFVAQLAQELQPIARDLPFHIGYSTIHEVPWSAVFNNIAILALPMFIFEKHLQRLSDQIVNATMEAHIFGIIGAFSVDRIQDGQITPDTQTQQVIAHVLKARDKAFSRLLRNKEYHFNYQWAEQEVRNAEIKEQELFNTRKVTNIDYYQAISRKKQSLALPACVAAVKCSEWDSHDCNLVTEAIESAALGLQYLDDVVDWIDDINCSGSWAVALSKQALESHAKGESTKQIAQYLQKEEILITLLQLSEKAFRQSSMAADKLQASQFSQWANERAGIVKKLTEEESREPGYAVVWEIERKNKRSEKQSEIMNRLNMAV